MTGRVLPVTMDEMTICAELADGTIIEDRDKIAETVFDRVSDKLVEYRKMSGTFLKKSIVGDEYAI